MQIKFPKVSFIISVFNDTDYLELALKSIFEQRYPNFEIILCDDGSGKDTKDIINSAITNKQNVILLENEINRGLPFSLNRCIQASTGEYIARMDGDDISDPFRIAKSVDFLEKNKKFDFVSTNAFVIDEKGDIIGEIAHISEPTFRNVLEEVSFIHPASIFRKRCLIDIGGYISNENTRKGRCEDYDLWCRLYDKGYKGFNIQEKLLYYRETRIGYSKRTKKSLWYLIKVKKKWYKRRKDIKPRKLYVYKKYIQFLLPRFFVDNIHLHKLKLKGDYENV